MAIVPMRRTGLIRQHTEKQERIQDMLVTPSTVHGRVLVIGTGEISVPIPFAIVFSERPVFTFGGELEVNHHASAGSFPTVSGVVVDWDDRGARPGWDGRFHGATVAIVTTGQDGQNMWFHYRFEGKALTNPLNTVDSADDDI
jgi:hypothetical protein